MDFPQMIQLETTSYCNAQCDFCLVPTRKRQKQVMEDSLFKKIVNDCKEFPLQKICPFLHGEPFMDNKFIERLSYINEHLPEIHFDIFSNMEVTTPEKIDKLSTIKNIDSFVMSVSGYDKESAYRHQKVDWGKVYNNAIYFINKNLEKKFLRKIEIVAMTYNESEKIKCREIWRNQKGIDNFFFTCKQNWLGDSDTNININYNKICARAFHLNIFSDGTVPLCCWQVEKDSYSIGNVKDNSVLEIYNSEKYKKYRNLQKKDLIPCNRCSE